MESEEKGDKNEGTHERWVVERRKWKNGEKGRRKKIISEQWE